MSVVAKLFISCATQNPDGSLTHQLGVVCRGEENKHWAAATPSGSMKISRSEFLDMLWREHLTNGGSAETEIVMTPDAEGAWVFDKCDFTYGGCQVHLRQREQPWGELSLTINASGATKVLREAYAAALIEGVPARFSVTPR